MGGKLVRTIGRASANFALTMMAACYNPVEGRNAVSEGDSKQNGATPPGKAVIRRRNRTEFGHGHHLAVSFTKNLGSLDVPFCALRESRAAFMVGHTILC